MRTGGRHGLLVRILSAQLVDHLRGPLDHGLEARKGFHTEQGVMAQIVVCHLGEHLLGRSKARMIASGRRHAAGRKNAVQLAGQVDGQPQ